MPPRKGTPKSRNAAKPRKRTSGSRAARPAIEIRGARQNNLKGIDLDLTLGSFHVITGPSGSGKSSLAFQTVYAEGQRRYVETFSPYTRQFFERMDKPLVDAIHGIPPAIALSQNNSIRTTRSTVGTMTEINDYLKLLFPVVATAVCPSCGESVRPDTPAGAVQRTMARWPGRTVLVTLPVPVPPKMKPAEFLPLLQQQGYLRVLLFGEIVRTDEPESFRRATLPAVVPVVQDRVRLDAAGRGRLTEAFETAFHLGNGRAAAVEPESGEQLAFSRGWHCAPCDVALREPAPSLFSFNNPAGACPTCRGFGRTIGIDPDRALPDKSLSIRDGVVVAMQGEVYRECQDDLEKAARRRGVSLDTPFRNLSAADRRWVLEGDPDYRNDPENAWDSGAWYGVRGFFQYLEKRAYKMHVRVFLSRYRSYTLCPACEGTRLRPEALAFRAGGMTLPEWWAMPVSRLADVAAGLSVPEGDRTAAQLQREVVGRLRCLNEVGLGYLNLDRAGRTLSGGEIMRVNLTACLGASLVNTLFVLDEPSVGLHPRDTGRLIGILHRLRDKGNTLLVVEHEESVIRAADNVIEIGPGRGELGGELVYNGPLSRLRSARESLTADYLLGRKRIPDPRQPRRPDPARTLRIFGATENNLKDIDVTIPLGLFCCVTGVSGSGKSTLVHSVLYNRLSGASESSDNPPGACRRIEGRDRIPRTVMVDQSPASRTPRSTPAVYTGAWDFIREALVQTPDAIAAGLTPGYFSFNAGTGRCGRCQGAGSEKVEMQFLSDLYVTCPECEGRRFRPDALRIRLRGRSVHDLLTMSVREAIAFLTDSPLERKAAAALSVLADVGLGYLRLGQPLNTLSGGESQRLKLVGELISGSSAETLFILDEPTTGLHFDDIALLLETLQRLVDRGHSLLVVEHNLEVIRRADWIVDLGPEAGDEGGSVVCEGTPAEVARCAASHTGRFLAQAMAGTAAPVDPPAPDPGDEDAGDNGSISIVGAREHNLRNLSVDIPRDKLVVVTGLSGSGKSTLAFDIVFAEGQRRFLDSMSTYARQFVGQLEKPDVDRIAGLPPSVAIEQRITRGGGKSTVATVTEIYHFLRLLYARVGDQRCPDCNVPVAGQSRESIADAVTAARRRSRVQVLAPLIRGRKGFHSEMAETARRLGIETLFVDGKLVRAAELGRLARFREHHIDAVVSGLDRLPPGAEMEEIVDRALTIGRGVLRLLYPDGRISVLNSRRACPQCSRSFDDLDPRLFSFNSRHGWCDDCRGYGIVRPLVDEPDRGSSSSLMEMELMEELRHESAETGDARPCPSCRGNRLNPEALHVFVHDLGIADLTALPVREAQKVLKAFRFSGTRALIAREIMREIDQRLSFLNGVGLGYLQLNRAATTLSGGESQRIRLAAQLGSNLRGVLYVLDEPTIGLHPRDNVRLLDTLTALRDRGNSLLVVEHDEETMRRSDLILDLGPGAGIYGGELVGRGTVKQIQRDPKSVTGAALRRPQVHPQRGARRPLPPADDLSQWIAISGARANNLRNVTVAIPPGRLTVVCGISGSGKSSLIRGVVRPAVAAALERKKPSRKSAGDSAQPWDTISGIEFVEAVYEVDQSPIGKTSRSTPATYIKVFDRIREVFAALPASRMRGYGPGRFSFNTEGGRCETCKGNGVIRHEMAFLPPSRTVCEECGGRRYNAATLEIEYAGRNIGQVMDMTIAEAAEFFHAHTRIVQTLSLLAETGTGYLKLGQPSQTLSGGEAQRMKLVAELSRGVQRTANARLRRNRRPAGNLYLIEEPTIGLHPNDVVRLIDVLHRLVDDGHTVVVIEHNLDVIAEADYAIELGPEAGADGGRIVATGTPEEIARVPESRTGPFL